MTVLSQSTTKVRSWIFESDLFYSLSSIAYFRQNEETR